ncbi:MAG TPA: NADH:ubiquinone oxidoreductase [Bacillota bacterium]|jgi:coenzyme F420-reducing hydrogenase gamma subunit
MAENDRAKGRKISVGVFGLTSCGGDQLVLLNCEDESFTLGKAVNLVAYDLVDLGRIPSDMDAALVEGAVVQEEDRDRLTRIRKNAKVLVALGTCAAFGGVMSGHPETKPSPVREFVQVDFTLPGCPVEPQELTRVLGSLIHGDLPVVEDKSVCFECRLQENTCLLKEKKGLCLGPVTTGGCSARCVSYRLTCRGCRGPLVDANAEAMVSSLQAKGWPREEALRSLNTFARDWVRLP